MLVVALELGWLPATGYIPFAEDPVEWLVRLTLPSITLGSASRPNWRDRCAAR